MAKGIVKNVIVETAKEKAAVKKANAEKAKADAIAAEQAAADLLAAEQAKADAIAAEQAAADLLAAEQATPAAEKAAADELSAYYAELEKADAKKEEEEEIEIELNEEDFLMNPDLALHGLKVGDKIKVPVDSFAGKLSPDDQQHLEEIMAPYLETYPEEKEFHVTTDGQVFLKRNEADARHHQKELDPEEEVFVYRA